MGKKVIFFLSQEQTIGKILFYILISAAAAAIFFSTTQYRVVQEGWGYGTAAPSAPSAFSELPSISQQANVPAPTLVVGVFTVGQSQNVSIGGSSHTVTVGSATDSSCTFTIQSEPQTLTLASGETAVIDTDGDGISDTQATYNGYADGKPQLTFLSLVVDIESGLVINGGAAEAMLRNVTLSMQVNGAAQMAVSNNADFSGAAFEPYVTKKQWMLSEGNGEKVVYVRFRSDSGATKDTADTIMLVGQSTDAPVVVPEGDCPLTKEYAYTSNASAAVYYITTDCTKRAFISPSLFFSYFASWSDVRVTAESSLATVADDALGFMPWGTLREYKNGDILKTTGDSRVYIIVNGKKNWITSEEVFVGLYGSWNVVEDVDPRVLASFEDGVEISSTEIHPDGTLVKSAGSPEVYVIEIGRVRHIVNENVFNSLNYRWDRIFAVDNIDVYDVGPDKIG